MDAPMTIDPNAPAPSDDPDKAELEALRKEKADRDAAAQAERDKELEDLRAFKASEEEKAAKAVKAPVKKADKPADVPATAPAGVAAAQAPGKHRKGLWWPRDDS